MLWRTKAEWTFGAACLFLPRSIFPCFPFPIPLMMRVNGRQITQLTQFRPRIVAEHFLLFFNDCNVHRTICHHAPQPSLCVKAPVTPRLVLRRGAKSKSTLNLKDLPQGSLKLESYNDSADDAPRYPAVVQGHRNNMQKFKNCVVLTRIGGFYEVRMLICLIFDKWLDSYYNSNILTLL